MGNFKTGRNRKNYTFCGRLRVFVVCVLLIGAILSKCFGTISAAGSMWAEMMNWKSKSEKLDNFVITVGRSN